VKNISSSIKRLKALEQVYFYSQKVLVVLFISVICVIAALLMAQTVITLGLLA